LIDKSWRKSNERLKKIEKIRSMKICNLSKSKHFKLKKSRSKTDLNKELKKRRIFDKSKLSFSVVRRIWKLSRTRCLKLLKSIKSRFNLRWNDLNKWRKSKKKDQWWLIYSKRTLKQKQREKWRNRKGRKKMLQFSKRISNYLTNKKRIELKNTNDERQDKRRIRIEWLRMWLKRLMIAKEEKMTWSNNTLLNEIKNFNSKNTTRRKRLKLLKKIWDLH